MSDHHSGPSHGGGGISLGASLAAGVTALIGAVSADLLQPMGPVALALFAVFVVVGVLTFLLSLLPPLAGVLRPIAGFALASALAFGAFTALQFHLAPQPSGHERGFLATTLSPLAGVQKGALSLLHHTVGEDEEIAIPFDPAAAPAPELSAAEKAIAALNKGLASPDPADRLRAGVEVLGDENDAVVAAAVDKLYRTNDPALRQLAVKRLLSMRRGARMPLLATASSPETQGFANALQGVGLTIRALNETSGAFDGGLCAPTGMAGTVNRTGVTIAARCKIGDAEHNTVLVLQPTDDFRLVGDARNDMGQSVKVELPLM